ncbi:MAG: hypothetical protein LBK54_06670 [Propionibacteriaceae bacterium]|jgi:hypothetical protein|nr:hypothetical protein [Propionibacteriaceae bacterium]
MTARPRRPAAFIDESYRVGEGQGFYIMAAAVIDIQGRAFERLRAELSVIAARSANGEIHAQDMARRSEHERLNQVERLISASPAVALIATVKAPVRTGAEPARQHCLADLAIELTRIGVTDFRLDTRRNPTRRATLLSDPKDRATIEALTRAGDIPPVRIAHVSSAASPGMWVADTAAYATHRTLARRDPSRLATLAWKLELREARHLPIDQRQPGHRPISPSTGLQQRLDDVRLVASKLTAAADKDRAYATADQTRLDQALERLRAVTEREADLALRDRHWEDLHHRPAPTLDDLLGA